MPRCKLMPYQRVNNQGSALNIFYIARFNKYIPIREDISSVYIFSIIYYTCYQGAHKEARNINVRYYHVKRIGDVIAG